MADTKRVRGAKSLGRVEGQQGVMAVVLRDVPKGHDWGWFSREDPRMHLQTVDEEHRNLYKVWLEEQGRRVFQPDGAIPAKVLKALRTDVTKRRDSIEAKWVNFTIKQGWLTHSVKGPTIRLTAYPGTNRFERLIDLGQYLAPEFVPRVTPRDVRLNDEYAVVEIWPERPEPDRYWIQLPPILWT